MPELRKHVPKGDGKGSLSRDKAGEIAKKNFKIKWSVNVDTPEQGVCRDVAFFDGYV